MTKAEFNQRKAIAIAECVIECVREYARIIKQKQPLLLTALALDAAKNNMDRNISIIRSQAYRTKKEQAALDAHSFTVGPNLCVNSEPVPGVRCINGYHSYEDIRSEDDVHQDNAKGTV